jgi:hypothetical protein
MSRSEENVDRSPHFPSLATTSPYWHRRGADGVPSGPVAPPGRCSTRLSRARRGLPPLQRSSGASYRNAQCLIPYTTTRDAIGELARHRLTGRHPGSAKHRVPVHRQLAVQAWSIATALE